ncbi:MAG: rhodanese-like domain-containing protein [Proteobacteria bacterium]|nr:rhodanese-like domain-containing protein [Pseudomonadota bacterium]
MTTTPYDLDRANRYFRDRIAFTTGVHELEVMLESGKAADTFQIVDVRYPGDFAVSRVPGAINLPKPKWRNPETILGGDKNRTLFLYCYNQTCHLAAEAAIALTAAGYKVVEVEGGFAAWEANGYRQEKGDAESASAA